jgi:uncharacterized Zn-finger protein
MLKRKMHCEYPGCSKTYCSAFNLKRHVESTHQGLRKFKCTTCGKFLSSKQNLIDHQNIHSGQKPYFCEIASCGMRFRQLSQYYLHRQLHSEISSTIVTQFNTFSCNLELFNQKLSKVSDFDLEIPIEPYSPDDCSLPVISSAQSFVSLPLIESLTK